MNRRLPAATLVCADTAGCSKLVVDGLSRLGRRSTVVHTPLDAIVRLQATTPPVGAALVSLQDVGFDISAFFELLKDDYPHVRRIAVAQREKRRQVSIAVHSCPHDVILWSPWDRPDFLEILGDALDGRKPGESESQHRSRLSFKDGTSCCGGPTEDR